MYSHGTMGLLKRVEGHEAEGIFGKIKKSRDVGRRKGDRDPKPEEQNGQDEESKTLNKYKRATLCTDHNKKKGRVAVGFQL